MVKPRYYVTVRQALNEAVAALDVAERHIHQDPVMGITSPEYREVSDALGNVHRTIAMLEKRYETDAAASG